MLLRLLDRDDAMALRLLRLEALRESPAAFSADYESSAARSVSDLAARIKTLPDEFIVGLFDQASLVGMGGLYRVSGVKLRHKAVVWGMYVTAEYRGAGAGRRILSELIRRAREAGDIRQVNISVVFGNDAARELYESCGFESFGREPNALQIDGRLYDDEQLALRL
jgi:GNAT superfamily N-acetyltransferase